MAYVADNGLGGWFSQITRVLLAPARAVFAGGEALFRGGSIGKAVNEEMQPAKKAIMQLAPIASFIPVYGTAIAAVIALEKLRQRRAAARENQKQSDAIDAEIAQTNAQIVKLRKKEARARGLLTANAAAGRVSAAKIVALDKKIPWGLIATAGAITIAALKK